MRIKIFNLSGEFLGYYLADDESPTTFEKAAKYDDAQSAELDRACVESQWDGVRCEIE